MLETSKRSLSTEEVTFLRERVARFGLVAAALGAAFWVFRLVQLLFQAHTSDSLVEPSFVLHLVAWALLLGIWLVNQSPDRSQRFVEVSEAVGLIGSCIAYIAMGSHIEEVAQPSMIVLVALTYALVARAAYVPSSTRRTLGISVVIGVPFVVMGYFVGLGASPDFLALIGGDLTDEKLTAADAAGYLAMSSIVWWSLTTALAVGITHVIYGLRREVRDVKRLGQYVLEEKIGEGGMGVVYRARHGMLRRPTAVKVLHPDGIGERAVERFAREVRLTARLSHPNTVTIYDYGRTPDGLFYYAMELLEGATLEEIVAVDGPQPPSRVVHILGDVASSLVEAHGVGLVHRDIKPGNIILSKQGGVPDVAKVVDFGLVKELDPGSDVGLTQEGAITGTPQYMPPESISAPDAVGPAGDLYSLGAVAYFLLTGAPVFDGKTVVEVCSQHLHVEPEAPSARRGDAIPSALDALVLELLQKDPSARPAGASLLRERLDALDVAPWTEEQARRWWDAHGGEVVARRGAPSSVGPARTLDVGRGPRS